MYNIALEHYILYILLSTLILTLLSYQFYVSHHKGTEVRSSAWTSVCGEDAEVCNWSVGELCVDQQDKGAVLDERCGKGSY